jgi:3-oxo-5alpha-steroid 4-dehydrogenase
VKATARTSTVTPVEPAREVASAEDLAWDDEADVLVVGWGAAGACAALEARAAGASVLVVDRFGGGGASVLSGGVVYAGGGTPYQRQAGYEDSAQAMFEYLRHEVQGVVGDDTLLRFCRDSVGNLAWLEAHGVRFAATMPDHKTSYPPEGFFLYHSGNESVPAYAVGQARPAPRGHRAVARGQSGATLYGALQRATRDSGARTLTQAAVRRLVRDSSSGRIVGVEAWVLPDGAPGKARHAALDALVAKWRLLQARRADQGRQEAARIEQAQARPVLLRARRGVVLATGGHVYNAALLKEHAPAFRRGWPIGGAGCDGSGLRLGRSVGAQAQALDNVSAWRFITPPAAWPRGWVVDTRGERFCNEEVYGATLGHAMMTRADGRAWLVIDARLRRQALRQCLFGGLWAFQRLPALALMLAVARKAATLEALAAAIGAEPTVLRATAEAANAAARGERDDPFGKSPAMRHPMDRGPYFALDISIGSKWLPLATLTLGGLQVNEADGHVVDAGGADIAGLYAAGRTAIGIPSCRYVSGLSLADCVFSGRRAGRSAAVDARPSRLAAEAPVQAP